MNECISKAGSGSSLNPQITLRNHRALPVGKVWCLVPRGSQWARMHCPCVKTHTAFPGRQVTDVRKVNNRGFHPLWPREIFQSLRQNPCVMELAIPTHWRVLHPTKWHSPLNTWLGPSYRYHRTGASVQLLKQHKKDTQKFSVLSEMTTVQHRELYFQYLVLTYNGKESEKEQIHICNWITLLYMWN